MLRFVMAGVTAAALGAGAAQAAPTTILSSDFDGRTLINGDQTATGIVWNTFGVGDPGDLTVDFPIFDTADGQDMIAVDRNLALEGDWSVDIPIAVGNTSIMLDTLSFEAFSLNNGGDFQAAQRVIDVQIELTDIGGTLVSTLLEDVQLANASPAGPYPVSLDLSSIMLSALTDYTLTLTFLQEDDGDFGNNAGFDNFALTGEASVVPLPAGLPLLLTGLGLVGWLRFRARA